VTGRCVDARGGYRCVCSPGYTGPQCDVDADDCATLRGPCLNGGRCVDGRSSSNFPGFPGLFTDTSEHIRFFSPLFLFSTVSFPRCRLILLM